jgi:hypothetical protein
MPASFANSTPTVYAVAHDPDTGRRVAERAVIGTRPVEMIVGGVIEPVLQQQQVGTEDCCGRD